MPPSAGIAAPAADRRAGRSACHTLSVPGERVEPCLPSRVARIILTAVLGVAGVVAGAAPASAAGVQIHTGFGVIPATTRQATGVVYGPFATCTDPSATPPDGYQLVVAQGDHVVARSATGYAAVHAGTYRVTAIVTCGRSVSTVAATLTVVELTDAQTVDEQELGRLRPGQSYRRVAQIVGGTLDPAGRRDSTAWFTKPNTTSGLSTFEFREGRLVTYQWSVGHD